MAHSNPGKGGKVADECESGDQEDAASQNGCCGNDDRQLTKEKLEIIFSEDDPHKQFE